MKGVVIKIETIKQHKDNIYEYYPVTIRLENHKTAIVHVIPTYRNYAYWLPVLKSGVRTVLDNLQFVTGSKKFLDKDIIPHIVSKPIQIKQLQLL